MIEKYSYRGEENTGFHTVSTNSFVLVPPDYKKKDFFDLPVVETQINQTRLIGLFAAGNSECLLVPKELSNIERQNFENSDIDFKVIDTRYNALGNLILCNDKGALVSPKLSDHLDEIEEALNVEITTGEIAGSNPGVSGLVNGKGAVIHRDASEEDALRVKEALDLEDVDIGTVNMGSPFVGSGATCNNKDLLTGEPTTGPEIGRFDRTLF